MGTSLNGLTPAGTYPGLIKTGDNAPIDGTLKTLSDGNGNNLPMSVSTTTINLTGTAQVGGVAIANTTQLAAKQDTLVSGTNIKTINGTSLLGSGNIPVVTSPSGVSGAIQFSDGSAFASDSTKFFWNNTTKRLGIGTNTPAASLDIYEASFPTFALSNTSGVLQFYKDANKVLFGSTISSWVSLHSSTNTSFGSTADLSARVGIRGSGSTSATTSLLVQNSGGSTLLSLRDDKVADFNGSTILGVGTLYANAVALGFINSSGNAYSVMRTNNSTGDATFDQFVAIGTTSAPNASAALDVVSTTKGFLPPRMTTTQRDLISSVATGLVLYNTTTNKLQCYNGSTWNDLF